MVIIEEQTFLNFQFSSDLLFNILFLEVQLILSVSHIISHILTPKIEIVKLVTMKEKMKKCERTCMYVHG